MDNSHFQKLAQALGLLDQDEIQKAIFSLLLLKERGGIAWIVGNGGSAATAGHFANDLVKIAGIRAVNLTDLVPTVTAYGNDNGWDRMYADALDVLAGTDDMVIAISCSGNSINVVKAAYHPLYLPTIVLTGNNPDCELSKCNPAVFIMAHSDDITIQEDVHVAVCHAIAKALRDAV